jgi:hypothetical protein
VGLVVDWRALLVVQEEEAKSHIIKKIKNIK